MLYVLHRTKVVHTFSLKCLARNPIWSFIMHNSRMQRMPDSITELLTGWRLNNVPVSVRIECDMSVIAVMWMVWVGYVCNGCQMVWGERNRRIYFNKSRHSLSLLSSINVCQFWLIHT